MVKASPPLVKGGHTATIKFEPYAGDGFNGKDPAANA